MAAGQALLVGAPGAPGHGTIWILKNANGSFSPVLNEGGNGIGGYDLADRADRAFAYDHDHSDKCDNVVLYRPGQGTIWILEHLTPFQSFLLQTGTALHETDDTFAFAIADWNRDGRPDLIAIKKRNTGTNSTAVHILRG